MRITFPLVMRVTLPVFSGVLAAVLCFALMSFCSPAAEKYAGNDERDKWVVEYAAAVGLMGKERYESAGEGFENVARNTRDPVLTARAAFLAGWCAYNNAEWRKAAYWFGTYLGGERLLDDYASYYRAISLTRDGLHEHAVAAWRVYFASYSDKSRKERYREARLAQADSLAALDRCGEALAILEELLKETKNGNQRARILWKTGNCLEETGKVGEAVKTYREIYIYRPATGGAEKSEERMKAIGQEPERMSLSERYIRASRLYDKARWEEALAEYEKYLGYEKCDRLSHNGRRAAVRKGLCLYKLYRTDEALAAFRVFIEELPIGEYSATAYYYYGHCFGRKSQNDKALEAYRDVIEKKPDSDLAPLAWLNIAQIYGERGKWEDALECLKTIRQNHPKKAKELDISWRIGWIYYRRERFGKAAESFSNHNGENNTIKRRNRYWTARAMSQTGEDKKYREIYKELVEEKPFGYYALWAWARLGKQPPGKVKPKKPRVHSIPGLSIKDMRLERSRELAQMGLARFAVEELSELQREAEFDKKDHEAIALLYQAYGDYYRARRTVWKYLDVDTENFSPDELRYWKMLYPRPYLAEVGAETSKREISPNLVWSIMRQESGFRARVRSYAGAVGLMQLIPPTAEMMAKRLKLEDFRESDLRDPSINIRMGVNYLADVAESMGDHQARLYLACAGYNGGPSNVKRWARARRGLEVDEWVEEIPFGQTRRYVKHVFSNWSVYRMLYGGSEYGGIPVPAGEKLEEIAPEIMN